MELDFGRVQYVGSKDGTRIAYAVCGSGPVLVHLPPWCFSHLRLSLDEPWYRNFLIRLAEGKTLIRIDSRGCGMSERNCADNSPEALTDDLEAVLDAARVSEAIIHATSVQTSSALRLTVRRPDMIRGLILGVPFVGNGEFEEDIHTRGALQLMSADWQLFLEVAAQRSESEGRNLAELRGLINFMRACYGQADTVAKLRASRPAEDWRLARQVECPALIVTKEDFSFDSDALQREFATRFKKGRAANFPSTEGWSPGANFEPFLAAIEEWMAVLPPPRNSTTIASLTAREDEIVCLFASGQTEKEIAELLGISSTTVSGHVAAVYRKLGIHRKAELVKWAVRNDRV